MSNKLTRMARELLTIEEDLVYRFNYNTNCRPVIDDFEMYTFEQTWGSTALGFEGIGGQAITTARTYVFVPQIAEQNCFVYFGGRFAYEVKCKDRIPRIFMDDIRNENMASVSCRGKYKLDK